MPAYRPDTNIIESPNQSPGISRRVASIERKASPAKMSQLIDIIESLHTLCRVYTRPVLVNRILDRVGWLQSVDLSCARLLEPSAGDGAFLVPVVNRLIHSLNHHGHSLSIQFLRDRILAYELAPSEANVAQRRVVSEMTALGVNHATARACAKAWIKNEDFLLANLNDSRFSHIVGNPPYVRWSKVPLEIKNAYKRKLPDFATKGDLFLPFLQRSFESLARHGRCVFACSDRWRYNAYADAFRDEWCGTLNFDTESIDEPRKVFDNDVSVQAEILTATYSRTTKSRRPRKRSLRQTLSDIGCSICVGPALGITPAYVLSADENDVEPDLLHNWIDSREVRAGAIQWSGRRVISPFDKEGNLVNLDDYPLLARRLNRFKDRLGARYIVRMGSPWYRTIEKINPLKWSAPKLLIPGVAKTPRVAMDFSGLIPSHGLYAVFHRDNDIEKIYDLLRDGKLAESLSTVAPTIGGGYRRCNRRFLERIEV